MISLADVVDAINADPSLKCPTCGSVGLFGVASCPYDQSGDARIACLKCMHPCPAKPCKCRKVEPC